MDSQMVYGPTIKQFEITALPATSKNPPDGVTLRNIHKLGKTLHAESGDILRMTVTDHDGTQQHFNEHIGRSLAIDTIKTYDVKGQYGFEDGVGCIFGKETDSGNVH